MPSFHFCRDGVLRTQKWHRALGRTVELPVELLQQSARSHRNLFLKGLTYGVTIEDGLTVGELFENLAPWSELMEGIACMDFAGFLGETRRPAERAANLDRVEISYRLRIEAVPDFEDPSSDEFLAGPSRTTDKVELGGGWSYVAKLTTPRIEGEGTDWEHRIDGLSLDYTPLNQWAHLPIVILRDATLEDSSWESPHLSIDAPLLNPSHPAVRQAGSEEGEPIKKRGPYRNVLQTHINAPEPTFMEAIVQGFLWSIGFNYSIAGRQDCLAILDERMAELDAMPSATHLIGGEVLFEAVPPGAVLDEVSRPVERKAEASSPEVTTFDPEDGQLEAEILACLRVASLKGRENAVRGLGAEELELIAGRATRQDT